MELHRALGIAAACTACAACVTGEPMDEVTATSLDVVQRDTAFAEITARPYPSTIGSFDVATYVSGDAADYRTIHPDASGSHARVAPGTVIVRAVLDGSGAVAKLTVMAKGPAGYDPSIGDWWFGVTAPDGTPFDGGGGPEVGRLADCHGCHLTRADDDFLFGVPASDE